MLARLLKRVKTSNIRRSGPRSLRNSILRARSWRWNFTARLYHDGCEKLHALRVAQKAATQKMQAELAQKRAAKREA
jgi:hypothetical protein